MMPKLIQTTLWYAGAAFVVVAIFYHPNDSGAMVNTGWDLLSTGVVRLGTFLTAVMQ